MLNFPLRPNVQYRCTVQMYCTVCTDVCQSRKNPSTVAAVRTVYTHEKNIFYYSVYAMINRLRLGQKVCVQKCPQN